MGLSSPEYWSGLPFPPPGDLPNSGIKPGSPVSPTLAGEFFTTSTTWEADTKTTIRWRRVTAWWLWANRSQTSWSLRTDDVKPHDTILLSHHQPGNSVWADYCTVGEEWYLTISVNKWCWGHPGISHCSQPQMCTLRGFSMEENRILILSLIVKMYIKGMISLSPESCIFPCLEKH